MTNQTFATILINQMNDPDCSMLTGMTMGQLISIRWILTAFIIYAILKAIDKLAFEPLVDWIKNKIYKIKRKSK